MIALAVLLLLLLILLLPVGVWGVYSEEDVRLVLKLGVISVPIYPRKQKEKPTVDKEKADDHNSGPTEKKRGGDIGFFKELLGIGLRALGCVKRKLCIRTLSLQLTVGGRGEDPAKAAVLYGRAWAAIGALIPVLENTFRIKQREIGANIDFCSEDTVVYGEADIRLRLGDVLWLLIYHGIAALRLILKQKGRKKHGTSHQ